MNKELPEFLQKVIKKYPQVWESYTKLGESVRGVGAIDERAQRLVKLGIAIGAGLEGGVHSHVRKCKKAGIGDEEIYHAAILAITTIGWPRAMASLSWVDDILGGLNK
ncbi:MAG TPA: carboxymuconolactone decarboxylase family protein [Candidatus Omnitrophica bacterium]|nr:carboxymuconolactone decarboxylase family protein [Candidatus Omnitrophota bacterium]